MSTDQVVGLALIALAVLWLALDARHTAKAKARTLAFRQHADQVLAAHQADVRNRNLEANKAARWRG